MIIVIAGQLGNLVIAVRSVGNVTRSASSLVSWNLNDYLFSNLTRHDGKTIVALNREKLSPPCVLSLNHV